MPHIYILVFKETVYKAVVDGDLARCSFLLFFFFFNVVIFCFFLSSWGMRERECRRRRQKTKVA